MEKATTGYVGQRYGGRTPHFQCQSCPHDSFDQGEMQRHVARVHPEALTSDSFETPGQAPPTEGGGKGASAAAQDAGAGTQSARPQPKSPPTSKGRKE